MTEFAHAVNYTMSFGCNVLPEDINKKREELNKLYGTPDYYNNMIWNITLTKESTDEEIANYLGLENYRDFFLTEAINMDMEEHHVYNKEETERIINEYQERLKHFREANPKPRT